MAYTVMAYTVMAYIIMAYIVMAYIVMAYVVMAYIVMAMDIDMCVGVCFDKSILKEDFMSRISHEAPRAQTCIGVETAIGILYFRCYPPMLSDATLRFDLALGVRRRHAPKVAINCA